MKGLETVRQDPLSIDIDLPLKGCYYPVGFPVRVETNSPDVMEATAECWGHYAPEFVRDAIELRVVVQPEGPLAQTPSHRAQGYLYSVVSDPFNFASVDLRALKASMFVSQATASDHSCLRWFFVESVAYTLLAQRYVVPVHAGCVARNGAGVLMCGKSGAGKSTLTFACARAGWTFVTDDCAWLLPDSPNRIAIGRPRQARFRLDAPGLFPELEGQIVRARPTGKVSIEVPMSAFHEIHGADRAPVRALVFLEREAGAARAIPISTDEGMARLQRDMPSYGPEVNAMHERTVRKLVEAPAYRMQYSSLDEAIQLLTGFTE